MTNINKIIKDQCERNFEDYLKDVHYKSNPMVLDDDLPDHFDEWISQQEPEDYMRHADNFVQQTAEAVLSAVSEMVEATDFYDWNSQTQKMIKDNLLTQLTNEE